MEVDSAHLKELARTLSESISRGLPVIIGAHHVEKGHLVVNTTADPQVSEGRPPTPKEVRAYLWRIRNSRQLRRARWVLWGYWMEKKESAVYGVAEILEEGVALRLKKRGPRFHIFDLE